MDRFSLGQAGKSCGMRIFVKLEKLVLPVGAPFPGAGEDSLILCFEPLETGPAFSPLLLGVPAGLTGRHFGQGFEVHLVARIPVYL